MANMISYGRVVAAMRRRAIVRARAESGIRGTAFSRIKHFARMRLSELYSKKFKDIVSRSLVSDLAHRAVSLELAGGMVRESRSGWAQSAPQNPEYSFMEKPTSGAMQRQISKAFLADNAEVLPRSDNPVELGVVLPKYKKGARSSLSGASLSSDAKLTLSRHKKNKHKDKQEEGKKKSIMGITIEHAHRSGLAIDSDPSEHRSRYYDGLNSAASGFQQEVVPELIPRLSAPAVLPVEDTYMLPENYYEEIDNFRDSYSIEVDAAFDKISEVDGDYDIPIKRPPYPPKHDFDSSILSHQSFQGSRSDAKLRGEDTVNDDSLVIKKVIPAKRGAPFSPQSGYASISSSNPPPPIPPLREVRFSKIRYADKRFATPVAPSLLVPTSSAPSLSEKQRVSWPFTVVESPPSEMQSRAPVKRQAPLAPSVLVPTRPAPLPPGNKPDVAIITQSSWTSLDASGTKDILGPATARLAKDRQATVVHKGGPAVGG